MTNGDRIRAMTDEELAAWHEHVSVGCDYILPKCDAFNYCIGVCKKAWLDWLKQEVKG
ncbi:MAG: hypothetical protein IJI40_01760 [Firmicutes bacterium]|nr:hypothetical protein [Bacillota bacterium]